MRIYIESSIPSFLTAKPSLDAEMASMQDFTKIWWETRNKHDLFVSGIVIEEITKGDTEAAKRRFKAIEGITVLEIATDEIEQLVGMLINGGAIPEKVRYDAYHIACAAVHRMDLLLTWNQKHIANSVQLPRITGIIKKAGYEMPVIKTPALLVQEQI